MRFDLQARFVAILLLVGIVAFAAAFAIASQERAHSHAVAEAAHALLDASSAQQQTDQQKQAEFAARVEAADHRQRTELMLTLEALALVLAAIALLVSLGLVQPIRRLAATVRTIAEGENITLRPDARRKDEIGELNRAFATISNALTALRQRMDHDAAQRPAPVAQAPARVAQVHVPAPTASTTMVMSGPSAPMPPRRDNAMAAPAMKSPSAAVANRARMVMASDETELAPATSKRDAARRLRLEDDLREAWQRGEMSVVYQPIHALVDAGMRGAEALLRWQHPVDGAIAPSEFILLAERSDIIVALGRNVLVQACSDASLWPSGGTVETTPFLSVNVSARQLQQGPQLFEAVVDALRRSGLEASRLHLELPVAALRSDDSAIVATIEQLRGLGVRIWLDAVGADAVDQARWMKVPVDGVKVGRSRIAGGGHDDPDDVASTGSIVATARALRIVAVVVGIEELAQLNVLREQGAELAQGYVLCRPVDTAEIGRRLLA